MQIRYHKNFAKNYKKRVPPNSALARRFRSQLSLLLADPDNPQLRNHKLIGKMHNFRAFSIGGDVRVIYKIVKDEVWLYDIGSHNQVY